MASSSLKTIAVVFCLVYHSHTDNTALLNGVKCGSPQIRTVDRSLRVVGGDFLCSVEAVVGEHDQRVIDRGERRFRVKSVKLHEQYQPTLPMSYDIALLELQGTIQFSK
ncbi:hypothetical protein MHYP_G00118870 [Metynnis hypsauchen]